MQDSWNHLGRRTNWFILTVHRKIYQGENQVNYQSCCRYYHRENVSIIKYYQELMAMLFLAYIIVKTSDFYFLYHVCICVGGLSWILDGPAHLAEPTFEPKLRGNQFGFMVIRQPRAHKQINESRAWARVKVWRMSNGLLRVFFFFFFLS